jgi:hypothetical protein
MASAIATTIPSGLGDEPLFVFGRERRLHARAYDYWVSLLHGRRMPYIGDLDPDRLSGFADRSVLVDMPSDGGSPVIAFLGRDLRHEAGVVPPRATLDDVPRDTLLSELLMRFSDIVAYQAPVGFEAEFTGTGGRMLHRGILLPFSDEHGGLASVYGVISWKQVAVTQTVPDITAAICSVMSSRPIAPVACAWGDGPGATFTADTLPPQPLDQRLATARTWAALAGTDRTRGHASIHAALGAAHEYLLAARNEGMLSTRKAVRLVFGADLRRLDRVRFAATLDHAVRLGLAPGQVSAWLDNHGGGHIAVAIAERQARRAARRADAGELGPVDTQDAPAHIALTAIDDAFLHRMGRGAPHAVDDRSVGAALGRARAG